VLGGEQGLAEAPPTELAIVGDLRAASEAQASLVAVLKEAVGADVAPPRRRLVSA